MNLKIRNFPIHIWIDYPKACKVKLIKIKAKIVIYKIIQKVLKLF